MAEQTPRHHVGLADDQQLVRAGFGMVLDSQPDIDVAWQVANGQEAITAAETDPVDVILMDVQMPVMDGISATREIVKRGIAGPSGQPVRVVVLTTFDTDNYVLGSVEAGASGFLLKDADPEEMIAAVRTVSDSAAVISPAATARLMRTVRTMSKGGADAAEAQIPQSDTPGSNDPGDTPDDDLGLVNPLTHREREILVLMAIGRSNQEIAKELFISLPTVKTHVGRVLSKTNSRDRVHAVLFAFKHGLVTGMQLLKGS